MLEQKWAAVEANDQQTAEQLDLRRKNQVRQDKEDHLLEQLEEITSQGYKWDGLKRLRAKFTPAFTKLKDEHGQHVPYKDYPHKAADYLHDVQWKPPFFDPSHRSRLRIPLQNGNFKDDDSPFAAQDLDSVLKQWLASPNRLLLLKAANDCLTSGNIQDEFLHAIVVSVYKKGDSSSLAKYRPISLLCSCNKIIAALVKNRLTDGLDSWLMKTQYGFRPGKSTSQAIFVARRLQDFAEKSKSQSTLILLDWEKAFDRVDQSKMIETLRRLLVPEKLCNLIASFYQDPKFKVKAGNTSSCLRSQLAGVRQGCPLSPYLFVLLMGALFTDPQG